MCVIIRLKKGQQIPYKAFENATFNNPHGYGVVTLGDGRMEVKRDCPEGGNDPKIIYKILEDNLDCERIVHLRWNTAGETSLDNTQPFDVLSSRKTGDLVFMHNGTLNSYKPSKFTQGVNYTTYSQQVSNDVDDSRSDTKVFVESFLTPLVANWRGEFEDTLFRKLVQTQWEVSSKGLLISSKGLRFKLGIWKTIKDDNDDDIEVSNDLYFSSVTRGPEKTRRDLEQKQKEDKEKTKAKDGWHEAVDPTKRSGTRFNSKGFPIFNHTNPIDFEKIFEDMALYTPEGINALSALTNAEVETLYNNKENMIALFMYIASEIVTLADSENKLKETVERLEEKKRKAEQTIISLKQRKKAA